MRSTVRIGARRDDDGVEEVGADPCLELPQVPHITVTNGGGELDLNGEDPAVAAFNDQVDLMLSSVSAEIAHPGLGRLGVNAHTPGD
ncbi:MAG TPA: hypothetical protein VMV12_05160 [Candidatus Micrarchaeaceae archaeon]|nr:hypothetical protein [Candidatus Micrarchaeaceae archaeon]